MDFQIGDIILSKTNFKWSKPMSWLGNIISLFIGAPNHVMVVIKLNGNWFIAEASENGCHIEHLDTRLKPKEANYTVLRRNTQQMQIDGTFKVFNDLEAFQFVNKVLDLLGRVGYGEWTLVYRHFKRLIVERINKIFGTKLNAWTQPPRKYLDSVVCSEFAAYLYKEQFQEWYKTNPRDLLDSKDFIHHSIAKFAWYRSYSFS